MSGGTANFVFRIRKPSGRSIIAKHAEPYVRSNSSMAFPVERMDFEANALRTVSSYLPHDDIVNAAEVYDYDSAAHVLTMSDGGSRNLKDAYSDPSLDVVAFGDRLGQWLARLHTRTTNADIGDNVTAKSIYRHSSQNLSRALENYGFYGSLGDKVNEEYGSLLATDNDCVCHGDFWPGNVLVGPEAKLTIVDWEMVRRGIGGMLEAFLKGYMAVIGGKPDKEFARRTVVHWGTHLAFWPTVVEWGSREETKEVVELGRDAIVKAMGGEWDGLRGGELSVFIP